MIQIKRLELAKYDVKYADDLFELWNDYEVIKYTYTPLMNTVNDCIRYIERRISKTDKDFLTALLSCLIRKQ